MTEPSGNEGCGGCMGLIALVLVLGFIMLAVAWSVSLVGHALALTPSYPEFDRHTGSWIRQHYDNVELGYVLTVVTLVVGVPASIALTTELWSEHPRRARAAGLAAVLVALVLSIAFAPAGRIL